MIEQHPLHESDDEVPTPGGARVEGSADDGAPTDGSGAGDAAASRRRSRIAAITVAATVLLTAGAGAGAWAATAGSKASTTAVDGGAAAGSGAGSGQSPAGQGGGRAFGGGQGFGGGRTFGGQGFGGQGTGPRPAQGGTSSAVDSTVADAEQIRGVVTILSNLGYQSGEAAGSGVVLTASGRVLTNNHVIDGATAIRVTDESTGRAYTAQVVGTNAARDVAVLQLQGASGLTPAELASTPAAVGDEVTAVGNAEGTGTLTAAEGEVTDLDQRITTRAEDGTAGETLSGLIETDADVVSGDSGGPLKDAGGAVVGITTAATSGTRDITGYAIPIGSALSVAEQILAGRDTDDITIGYPAFLGVSLDPQRSAGGAVVAGAIAGTPAATAGIAAGSTVTALGGTAVDSGDALSAAVKTHAPGDRVSVSWTDADGTAHTATVVLAKGPAD